MLPKPSTCSGCPLAESGTGFCPDLIVKDADFTIYGEAPGTNEVEQHLPFIGKAGFVLKNWLMHSVPLLKIAQEKNRISYKNILHCLPPMKSGRPYPTGKDKEAAETQCAQYRSSEDAKVVILCGEHSQRAFFGPELEGEDAVDRSQGRDAKGVMGRIGRTYELDGRTYVFAPHPAFILRQPSLVTHGQRALEIATKQTKVLEPSYTQWEAAMGVLNESLQSS